MTTKAKASETTAGTSLPGNPNIIIGVETEGGPNGVPYEAAPPLVRKTCVVKGCTWRTTPNDEICSRHAVSHTRDGKPRRKE